MPQPSYLRFPSLRGDVLSFVADDDVWLAPAAGGTARRLTADHAPVAVTRLSPDGSRVAFTSRRDGEPEVNVVATDGGTAERLSFFGDAYTRVLGWLDDTRVLAVSASGQPFRSRTWAYAVRADRGAPPEQLRFGPITGYAPGPAGALVLGVNQGRSAAAWKRYRGGRAPALWIDRDGSGSFERFLAGLHGQLEDPVFVGERVVFVSDHEGVGNLYSALPDGSDLRRHSDHADFYARAAASDGQRTVYQCAGEVYLLGALARDSQPSRVEIELGAPRSGRARRMLKAADELGEHAPDATGRASAVEVRGSTHWLTHRDGPARYLAGGDGTRCRLPTVLGEGEEQLVCFVTDAEGEDAVEVVAATGEGERRRLGAGRLGRVLELAGSPDGRHAAVATHDGRVVLLGLDDGALRTFDHSFGGDASGLAFSPDSAWLAWSHAGPSPLRQIKLARVEGGDALEATPLRFVDHEPVFTLDGRYLAFISERTFDPVYDAHVFDLSFQAGGRPYLLVLRADTPSPFAPELAGRAPSTGDDDHASTTPPARRSGSERRREGGGRGDDEPGGDEPGAGREGGGGDAPPHVVVDIEGLAERQVPFPVPAGRYANLRAAHDGVLWLSEPLTGVLGESRAGASAEPERAHLVRYDFAKRRSTELAGALDSFEVSGDGAWVVLRDKAALRVVPADHAVEPAQQGDEEDDADEVVEVDLSRLRVEVDPALEWRQMYAEAARLMRDHFWTADMCGVDWDSAVARYRPWLERIATRDDLSELLWELQGELATSHAYETPPPKPTEAERRLGLLGADLARDGEARWRVERVLPGESSVRAARSPLAAPGVGLRAGDAILAVDGRPVDQGLGPQAMLAGTAGKPVELTVLAAAGGQARRVVVEPLADERPLRYQAWVAERRARTHERSGGRVGYLHVPDMVGSGWAELHRDLRVEVARDALVIDVRDNNGGHTSELVLEKLARTVVGWDLGRHVDPVTYPSDSPRGPRILVCNESTGSDGDIVTAAFRVRGVGSVVGSRTWGGVIGIDSRYQLVDRGRVDQPRYAFWFAGGLGWGVENHGADPDVEVPVAPQDWAAGRDPQLDQAVFLALERLETEPPARPPDLATRPSKVGPPQLPARP